MSLASRLAVVGVLRVVASRRRRSIAHTRPSENGPDVYQAGPEALWRPRGCVVACLVVCLATASCLICLHNAARGPCLAGKWWRRRWRRRSGRWRQRCTPIRCTPTSSARRRPRRPSSTASSASATAPPLPRARSTPPRCRGFACMHTAYMRVACMYIACFFHAYSRKPTPTPT